MDAAGLKWIISNQQGTGVAQIDSVTLTVNRRRSMPFGEPRGTQPTWLGSKGYVGGTKDDTGLTHLGAREYDPTTGRFISVDPEFDLADPQSWHAYAYGGNSPITFYDPDGRKRLYSCDCVGGPAGGVVPPIRIPFPSIPSGARGQVQSAGAGAAVGGLLGLGALLLSSGDADATDTGSSSTEAVDSNFEGVKVVDENGEEVTTDPIANKLKGFTEQAIGEWKAGELGLTREQKEAIALSPNPYALSRALQGAILDARVKELVEQNDPELAAKLFATGPGLYGPDWVNVQTIRDYTEGAWYDLTTPRQWKGHVKKYSGSLGKGVGIIWNTTIPFVSSRYFGQHKAGNE